MGVNVLVSDTTSERNEQAVVKLVSESLTARITPSLPTPDRPPSRSTRTQSPHILVVEDEVDVRKVISIFLDHQGYDCVIATDARHALSILDEQDFDLLLTDVIMPNMKGPELYAACLEKQPNLKVLFVSGYSEDMLSDPGSDLCYAYLPKPFTLAQLDIAIQEAVTLRWIGPKRVLSTNLDRYQI